VTQEFIRIRKIKIPKALNDVPCGRGEGIRVRIKFTKLFRRKKWGILIKKESETLDFTGLKIPRDYYN
jgi:hypothetical protein